MIRFFLKDILKSAMNFQFLIKATAFWEFEINDLIRPIEHDQSIHADENKSGFENSSKQYITDIAAILIVFK